MDDKLFDIDDITNNKSHVENCREFYSHISSLQRFGNYFNEKLSKRLFGNDEGTKLWRCFVYSCNRDVFKFYLSYLTSEQMFVLSQNVIECENKMRMISKL